ncbi:MAG: hypothetical protein LBR06_06925, partial [Bacteroidales bacterium]|nr:hypothetical protein [Bacteroidales bacterium]
LPNAHLSIIISDPFEDETDVDYAGKTIDDVININHKTRYSTVHDAIAAAVPGDSIFVPTGTFQVPEKETIPANIVLIARGTTATHFIAPEGFVLGGVLQNVTIMQCNNRASGQSWTTRATGVEMLENSALKNVVVTSYWTGVSAKKTTGIVMNNAETSYNYYGTKFTGGVAVTLNDFTAIGNDIYGIGFFQGGDAIAENKPTFSGKLTMRNNFSAQIFNAWDDDYEISFAGITTLSSNSYNKNDDGNYGLSNFLYERDPDVDMSGDLLVFQESPYIAAFVAKKMTNLPGNTGGANLLNGFYSLEFDGVIWNTFNSLYNSNVIGSQYQSGSFYQWNATNDSWSLPWTGSSSTPTVSDTWTATQPCPAGWRLPTKAEVEHLLSVATGSEETVIPGTYSCYKWTYGERILWLSKEKYLDENTGADVTGDGYYWTSESSPTDPAKAIAYGNTIVEMPRAAGLMVRCVHKEPQSDGTWQ